MKNLFFVILFFLSGICNSQIIERIMIDGTISVPAGDDPEGIAILNTTTGIGTVSNEEGKFMIAVGPGDELKFSALQYQDFTLVIDQKVMDARELNVFITQSTTELPEVVVSPFDLSGNVKVDVRKIPIAEADLPQISQAEIYSAGLSVPPDSISTPENAAMDTSLMEHGLNFANIFREIFATREREGAAFDPIAEDVRKLYDDEFFKEHLNIERENITDFIYFAEENGLSEELLREGNELGLVEFLITQSEIYKQKSTAN